MESDISVLQRVKKGDINAFSELVMRHQRSLLRLATRVLGDLEAAEDVVQESFLKAFQKIESFEGRASFKSWMYQITLNTARNKLRGKKIEPVEVEKVNLSVESTAEKDIQDADLSGIIQDEVAKLPNRQKTALNLRIYEDLSFAEIADIMECPYDTAKANYRHAIMKLRHNLGDSMIQDGWVQKINENKLAEA